MNATVKILVTALLGIGCMLAALAIIFLISNKAAKDLVGKPMNEATFSAVFGIAPPTTDRDRLIYQPIIVDVLDRLMRDRDESAKIHADNPTPAKPTDPLEQSQILMGVVQAHQVRYTKALELARKNGFEVNSRTR